MKSTTLFIIALALFMVLVQAKDHRKFGSHRKDGVFLIPNGDDEAISEDEESGVVVPPASTTTPSPKTKTHHTHHHHTHHHHTKTREVPSSTQAGVAQTSTDAASESETENTPLPDEPTKAAEAGTSETPIPPEPIDSNDKPKEDDNESEDEDTNKQAVPTSTRKHHHHHHHGKTTKKDEKPSATEAGIVETPVESKDTPKEDDNESEDEDVASVGTKDTPKEDNEVPPVESNETPKEDDNESEDEDVTVYRCGPNYGKCREWECCSKYGWCGTTAQHCSIEAGCQSEFGKCYSSTTRGSHRGSFRSRFRNRKTITKTKIATKSNNNSWRCGERYGSCQDGYCCSKYGWCGKSEAYCKKSKGCQSEFGRCW